MRSEAEITTLNEFEASYRHATAPVVQEIERQVCGCDYGGTSWTTRAEAEIMAQALALAPGKSLLEVGAGAGWPSLYLAKQTGCAATLIDLPLEGLRAASERAVKDGIADRCTIEQGDAASLPFATAAFDAISHSDVLCCLPDKLDVLRECRRVIRPSGRMVFAVIYLPAGLKGGDLADALEAGPRFIASDMNYEVMLAHAGWRLVSRADRTGTFMESMRRMIEAREQHSDALTALLGAGQHRETLARMRQKLPAIQRRLLERALFVAEPM